MKSTGDGFLLTFSSPRQAVSFASRRRSVALAGSLPRVRVGINTGEVIAVDADPLGAAVNAAARIAGRAERWRSARLRCRTPVGRAVLAVRFVDRGRCRLKGFAERWHSGRPRTAPEPAARRATIGRIGELSTLDELVVVDGGGCGAGAVVRG